MIKKRSKTHWQLNDLIDLEYFLHQDDQSDLQGERQKLSQRDREIYLKDVLPFVTSDAATDTTDTKRVLRLWLGKRRQIWINASPAPSILPGSLFKEIQRIATIALVVFGFMSGMGAAFAILTYNGTQPVNVAVYLGLFVLVQLFLLLLAFTWYLFYRLGSHQPFPVSAQCLRYILNSVATFIVRKIYSRFTADQRNQLLGALGAIRQHQHFSGKLYLWPLFILVQTFAVGTNCGILTGTLIKVTTSDLAFGWQSTIQFSAQTLHTVAQWMAWPWSWIVSSPIAYPTLKQIQGSHMILKNGILQLSTADLTAWWPFLCLAVLFYGLLPRFVTLSMGIRGHRRTIINFDHHLLSIQNLMQRMHTPLLDTRGGREPQAARNQKEVDTDDVTIVQAQAHFNRQAVSVPSVLFIPDELYEQIDVNALESQIRAKWSIEVKRIEKIEGYLESDKAIFSNAYTEQSKLQQPRFIIIQEAWLPPILETLDLFKQLRLSYQNVIIQIILIGMPHPGEKISAVNDPDWRVWQREIQKSGDSRIYLDKIG